MASCRLINEEGPIILGIEYVITIGLFFVSTNKIKAVRCAYNLLIGNELNGSHVINCCVLSWLVMLNMLL